MKYGFIGLGNLGALLAGHLVRADEHVIVFDLDADAVARLASAGATPAQAVKDAAASADVLITCLPSPKATESVVLGDILEGDSPTSSRSPGFTG